MTKTRAKSASLHAELDAIANEFGFASLDNDTEGAMAALNAELQGSEFGVADSAGFGAMASLDLGSDPMAEAMIFGWIRDRAKALIDRLVGLARRYRNCPKCLAHVTAAVAAFKSGNFLAAIAAAGKAIACFRSCAG